MGDAPKEVLLGGAPKEVLLGDAPKEVLLGDAPKEVLLRYAAQQAPLVYFRKANSLMWEPSLPGDDCRAICTAFRAASPLGGRSHRKHSWGHCTVRFSEQSPLTKIRKTDAPSGPAMKINNQSIAYQFIPPGTLHAYKA